MRKLLSIILLIIGYSLLAQDVTIESSTEEVDSASFSKLVRSYNRIIMAEREEVTLVKLDLLGPLLYGLSGIDTTKHNVLGLAFERKFKPEWSWVLATDMQVKSESISELRYRGGVRYYFDMEKRILRGRSANNLSANYLSGRISYRKRPKQNDDQVSVDLLVGVQRRLWKYGFIDVDVGIANIIAPYRDNTFGIDLTSRILLGIAF